MARVRVSTTVDADLLAHARRAREELPDSALIDEALQALLKRIRAAEIEAQICASATGRAGYQVTCAADVRAAAEVNKLRATLGQCDQGNECVDEVMRVATGEEALKATLQSEVGGLTLVLTRVSSDGKALRRCSRSAADAARLSADVAAGVAEALTR